MQAVTYPQKCLLIIEEHLSLFQNYYGEKLPADELLKCLCQGTYFKEGKIDHAVLGLLLGYPEKDVLAFSEQPEKTRSSKNKSSLRPCHLALSRNPLTPIRASFFMTNGKEADLKDLKSEYVAKKQELVKFYYSEDFLEKVLNRFMSSKNPRMELSKYIEKANEENALAALKRAEDFLANLSSQKELITLRSGQLLYKVLNSGSGSAIKEDSSPLVHFTEKDLDGEVLYDTHKSNSPMRLALDETILGFKLGVMGMKIGERREIIVHPDLAYKKLGKTKPNQLLIYDVTILEE